MQSSSIWVNIGAQIKPFSVQTVDLEIISERRTLKFFILFEKDCRYILK